MTCRDKTVYVDKTPKEEFDVGFTWEDRLLTGETIVAQTWTIEAEIASGVEAFTDTTTLAWIKGGSSGQTYNASVVAETSEGRKYERFISVIVC